MTGVTVGSVARRPDGRWRARYRGPDRRERSRHFNRKIDAEKWLAAVEVAKGRGEWVDPRLSRVTVGEWSRQWLDAQAGLKATTRARYEGLLRRQVLPTWERVPIAEVAPADVAAWVRRLSESGGLAPATVRYAHRVLSLLLGWAVLDGRLARNPAEGAPLPRARGRDKVYLSHREVGALADESAPHGDLVHVLAYTGLRWGEVAALRVEDVDLQRRRLCVRQAMAEVQGRVVVGTPKDHEQREVPFPRFLLDPLTARCADRAGAELVFAGEGGTFLRNGNFRRRVFDAAAERAGVAGVTPHGLRHTAASLAVAAGASVVLVQRMLGHASPSITLDVYSHLFADDLDAVAERLNDAMINAFADQVRTESATIDASDDEQEGEDDA